jgi:hypothetical protein
MAIGAGIGIPFKHGINWNSYWMTREPSGLSVTITGSTKATVGWTDGASGPDGYKVYLNNVYNSSIAMGAQTKALTGLTADTAYVVKLVAYKGTHESTGISAIGITNPAELYDSNLVAWFDYLSATADGSNHVTEWDDKSANAHHLTTVAGTPHKTATGILFDGVSDSLKSANFTLNSPEYVYMVINYVTYTAGKFADGKTTNLGLLYQGGVGAPVSLNQVSVYAGTTGYNSLSEILPGHYFILRCLLKGGAGASKIKINGGAWATGTSGANNMGGITLGANGSLSAWANVEIKEVIYRKAEDSDAVSDSIYNYLMRKYPTIVSPVFDKGKVIFSFDDGLGTFKDDFNTVFAANGKSATFHINGSVIGTGAYLTWANLRDMHTAGADIQCHSYVHDDLTSLTEAQVIADMVNNDNAFVANGLPAPRHLAYPSGLFNANVESYIAPYRDTARTTVSTNVLRPIYSKHFELPSPKTDNTDVAQLNTYKLWIDYCEQYRLSIRFYGHEVNNNVVPQLVAYAMTKNVDIINVAQYYQLIKDYGI